MNIRKASLNDLETLLLFGKELHFVEREFEPNLTYFEDEARERYTRQLQNPLALFLIAQDDQHNPVGYLYAHVNGMNGAEDQDCNLEVIYIQPEFRGRGLSADLIRSCVEWAKEKKVRRVKTEIFAKNKSSISAFEKFGFDPYIHIYSFDVEQK